MMTLKQHLMEKGLTEKEAIETMESEGICWEKSQNQEIVPIGTCKDGNERATVYSLPENDGFFYIDASAGDIVEEGLPEDFKEN